MSFRIATNKRVPLRRGEHHRIPIRVSDDSRDIFMLIRRCSKSTSHKEDLSITALLGCYFHNSDLLTVSEAEGLLMYIQSSGFLTTGIQNLVCAICIEPWYVDLKLGGCGICYFGNFGEPREIDYQLEFSRKILNTNNSPYW